MAANTSVHAARGSDDGLRLAGQNADIAAQYVAALMSACEDDARLAAELTASPSSSQSDQDTSPDDFLLDVSRKLAESASAFRSQIRASGVSKPSNDPAKLARYREAYPRQTRSRDLRGAEGDYDRALRRLRIDEVAIDPAIRKALVTARGFVAEFRKARRPADSWAGRELSPEWRARLDAMDRHAADLGREIKLLEIYVYLAKLDELILQVR